MPLLYLAGLFISLDALETTHVAICSRCASHHKLRTHTTTYIYQAVNAARQARMLSEAFLCFCYRRHSCNSIGLTRNSNDLLQCCDRENLPAFCVSRSLSLQLYCYIFQRITHGMPKLYWKLLLLCQTFKSPTSLDVYLSYISGLLFFYLRVPFSYTCILYFLLFC